MLRRHEESFGKSAKGNVDEIRADHLPCILIVYKIKGAVDIRKTCSTCSGTLYTVWCSPQDGSLIGLKTFDSWLEVVQFCVNAVLGGFSPVELFSYLFTAVLLNTKTACQHFIIAHQTGEHNMTNEMIDTE